MKYPLSVSILFIWVGFVCAISFMEAWLKFRASGVTLPIGLNIGKIVFGALNKMEWLFFMVVLGELIVKKAQIFSSQFVFLLIPFVILILQSLWLLPLLNERADLLIHRQTPVSSNIHFIYIGVETLKIICLFIFGFFLLKGKIHGYG